MGSACNSVSWWKLKMVSLGAALYQQHPEWVYAFKGRARTLSHHQLGLNLEREDVSQ
jgi:alpha-galactosidase